ncbi:hypothetical protein B0187_02745 [Haemophilus paracuniculus]|uniref:Bacteriophage T5 Orf172 DNA-binding domain-containing protein n=1 Tax=Haemophilus paracuniculus TaxID=734 RepID=A0A1T0AT50_9PAST|nr:GIY-YIG nuclease family protein [Haemophilus paracuniculus]OOR99743.1 hypothetical protein B0187_02745 [Haemophilus paracuniculus]
MSGWVYVLSNPIMKDILKIGYTDRDPYSRAKELNHTGVPMDYVVEYQVYVTHPYQVEQKVHSLLSHCRVNDRREFFYISYEDAVAAIREAIKFYDETDTNFSAAYELSHKVAIEELNRNLIEKKRRIIAEQRRIEEELRKKKFLEEQERIRREKEKLRLEEERKQQEKYIKIQQEKEKLRLEEQRKQQEKYIKIQQEKEKLRLQEKNELRKREKVLELRKLEKKEIRNTVLGEIIALTLVTFIIPLLYHLFFNGESFSGSIDRIFDSYRIALNGASVLIERFLGFSNNNLTLFIIICVLFMLFIYKINNDINKIKIKFKNEIDKLK